MILTNEKSFKMKIRDMENAFKHRRIPYPKRSVELIALLAISCTFFLFMHTSKLNNRLKEMEIKLQPSEFSALGITGEHHILSENELSKPEDINTLHGTYQYLKSTGQRRPRSHEFRHQFGNQHIDENELEADHHNLHDDVEDELEKQALKKHKSTHKNEKKNKKQHNKLEATYDYQVADDDAADDNDDDDDDYDEFSIEALNNTKNAEIELVVFNRVPKVGSQALMDLINRLSGLNGFTHARDVLNKHEVVLMKPQQQRNLIKKLVAKDMPFVYTQHVAFLNFTRFKMPRPIYINLVRDPIERIISWHYYVRARWYYKDMKAKLGANAPPMPNDDFLDRDLDTCVRERDLHCQFIQGQIYNPVGDHRRQTLFFCGQNKKVCMPFNSLATLQRSKRTVEEEYAVVGTWEDTNITLAVLEHYIPRFFKHATTAYHLNRQTISKVNKNPNKKPISAETREILRRNFTREIEFYEFCKQRLYLQYAALKGINLKEEEEYVDLGNDLKEESDEY